MSRRLGSGLNPKAASEIGSSSRVSRPDYCFSLDLFSAPKGGKKKRKNRMSTSRNQFPNVTLTGDSAHKQADKDKPVRPENVRFAESFRVYVQLQIFTTRDELKALELEE